MGSKLHNMVKVSSEVKAAIISAMVSLITAALLIHATVPGPVPQLRISPNSSDGWMAVDTHACMLARVGTVFRFEIAAVGLDHVLILRMILNATNWSQPYVKDFQAMGLNSGDLLTLTYQWAPEGVNPGHQASFTVSIVTAELPLQTLRFCIAYS